MRLLGAALGALALGSAAAAQCQLLDKGSGKPEPSLTQCYKYNTDACCVSAHDSVIKEAYEDMLSAECVDEYPFLATLFCIGCNPRQGEFTDEATKTVRVCEDLARELWDEDPKQYDACGLKTYGLAGVEVLVPGTQLHNATELMNSLSIPFFPGYTFEVVTGADCLSSPAARAASWGLGALAGLAGGLTWVLL